LGLAGAAIPLRAGMIQEYELTKALGHSKIKDRALCEARAEAYRQKQQRRA
jgi:hypothetical protein